MFIAEWSGVHRATAEPFTIKFELIPVSIWHRWRPFRLNKPWLVECLVDFRGSTYHHYEYDFWAWTVRSAICKAQDLDKVWWKVRESPTEEWWV